MKNIYNILSISLSRTRSFRWLKEKGLLFVSRWLKEKEERQSEYEKKTGIFKKWLLLHVA